MGQIIRTEAIVLRKIPFRETSQIVTLFTREKGKIAALAKGARKLKSQFGATLQPMSHIQAIFYYKPTRDLQTLSETSHITVFNRISDDLDRITVGMRMVEFVQALMQREESSPPVFNLLVNTLHHLDHVDVNPANIWLYFQLQISGCLGFQPDIDREEVEALPDKGGLLLLDSGAILSSVFSGGQGAADQHASQGIDDMAGATTSLVASRTALRAFAILARAELPVVTRLNLKPDIMHEVSNLVDRYLKFHFEDTLPTRSDRVIGQLKR